MSDRPETEATPPDGDVRRCIFIVGTEGSGSTYIARLLSGVLNGRDWSGRGFNCCDDGQCDRETGFTRPCSSPEHLVCHRSLPFSDRWPPIEHWQSIYDCRFVICTRDSAIAQMSVERRFGKNRRTACEESIRARRILSALLASDASSFLWSYETFALLDGAYLDRLYSFLGVASTRGFEPFRDENRKYIRRPDPRDLEQTPALHQAHSAEGPGRGIDSWWKRRGARTRAE